METKSLLFGIIGFLLGGLVVSVAAVTIEQPKAEPSAMTSMVDALKDKTGDEFDKAFVAGMIAHHQDAIDMSKLSQQQAGHQEIKDLSTDIIEAQQKEINQMRQWQADWGYPTAATGHSASSH